MEGMGTNQCYGVHAKVTRQLEEGSSLLPVGPRDWTRVVRLGISSALWAVCLQCGNWISCRGWWITAVWSSSPHPWERPWRDSHYFPKECLYTLQWVTKKLKTMAMSQAWMAPMAIWWTCLVTRHKRCGRSMFSGKYSHHDSHHSKAVSLLKIYSSLLPCLTQ